MHLWYRYRIVTFTVALWSGDLIGTWIQAQSFHTSLPIYAEVAFRWGPTATRIVILIGAITALLGFALRLWGSSYLGRNSVWSTTPRTQLLIENGPFAWVRNPLYLGNFFVVLGFAPGVAPLGILGAILALGVTQRWAIRHEEQEMLTKFGTRFVAYMNAVPRWLPNSWQPKRPSFDERSNSISLQNGISAEMYTVGIVISLFLWALGPPQVRELPSLIILIGLVVQLLVNVRRRVFESTHSVYDHILRPQKSAQAAHSEPKVAHPDQRQPAKQSPAQRDF